jgi:hypothetical protein
LLPCFLNPMELNEIREVVMLYENFPNTKIFNHQPQGAK